MPSTKVENAATKMLPIFRGSESLWERAPNFVQSLDLIRPEILSTGFEWPKSITAFLSYLSAKNTHKKFRGSPPPLLSVPELGSSPSQGLISRWVGRVHTKLRASTGLVVSHCAAAVAPKCNSCVAWHDTLQHFLSLASHFGATGRNVLQWPPDNDKAP